MAPIAFTAEIGPVHFTLTLEASGGHRLATLPQAFVVHHWLRRGRVAVLALVLATQ